MVDCPNPEMFTNEWVPASMGNPSGGEHQMIQAVKTFSDQIRLQDFFGAEWIPTIEQQVAGHSRRPNMDRVGPAQWNQSDLRGSEVLDSNEQTKSSQAKNGNSKNERKCFFCSPTRKEEEKERKIKTAFA